MEPKNRVWNIFVVDDGSSIVRAVCRALKRHFSASVTVSAFTDPVMALAKIDASVDILITDHDMPNIKGPELIAGARKKRPEIRAILMSGDETSLRQFRHFGNMPDVVTMEKPYEDEHLIDLVTSLMHT